MKNLFIFSFVILILSGFNGKAQTALEFDGIDDYVQTSFPGVIENDPRTIQAWIYLSEAPTSDMCILDYGHNEEGGRNTFMVNQNGYLQFDIGGDMLTGTFGGTLPIGEWTHVAFVYDGSEGFLYVNGGKVDNGNLELLTLEDEELLRIGESILGGMPFKGMIDEVSIWETGMEDEIIECYNGAIPEQVVAYYDFNDGSGMTLTELVAGWNGTLENMTEDAWVASTVCTTAYNVSFVVTKDDGTTPIENAMVDLDGDIKYTDANGETVFQVPAGTYDYTVSKAGYFDESSTVEVVNTNVTVEVSMTLNGIMGDITFIVSDELSGDPVENALVDLDGVQQFTNASGETVFTDYLPETYDYTITKSDYYEQSGSVEVIDEDVTENVDLSPIVYYDVTFVVTEAAGATPLQNVPVEFNGVQQYTDASGETTFTGYLPGTYAYFITEEGYYEESGEVEVTDGDVTLEVGMLIPVATALDFDGTNEYVQTSCPGVLANNPRTLMAWIYLDETSSGVRCIMDYGANNPYSRNTFMVNGSGYLSYLSGGSGSGITADVASVPLNEWVSVALVYDGTDAFIYQNGEQVGTKTFASGVNTQSGGENLKIGQRVAGGSIPFDGMIDELKIWSVALTQQEVIDYACIIDPTLVSNLLAHYDFNEGTGTILHDIAGGYNGTLLNMEDEDWIDSDVCVFSAYNISFVVTEDDGTTPIENASIDLDGEIKYTDANGGAVYYYYEPGTYNYTISKTGYFDETGTVEVVDQNVSVNVNLILTGVNYDITFVVTDDISGDPLEDALVELDGVQQYTDEFGEAVFAGYIPGSYEYSVTKDEYLDQNGSVEVMDEDVTVNISLVPIQYFDITFVVTDDLTGNPIEDALVDLNGILQYTDASGETVFTENLPGTFNYLIAKGGYYEQSGSVEVIDQDVTIYIGLAPVIYFDITFVVTDDLTGNPIEDALVDLDGVQQYTDASGETVFAEYLSGTYDYLITKAEYADQSGTVEVMDDDVTVNISLAPVVYFDVTFIVSDDVSGDPIEDALVELDGQQQYTNASGETTFSGFQPDVYPFTITKDGYFTYSEDVEVIDENLTIEVGLLLSTNTPTALEFDGVDDYVQTTYPGVGGVYSRTFQAWIYLHDAPSGNLCISDYGLNVAGGRNTFMVNGSGYLAYLSGGSSGGINATETTVPIGQWVHVAFVYDGIEGYLYQDGEQVGTGNLSGVNTQGGGQDLLIGQRVSGGNIPFDGIIDEFSMWDLALTPQQIIDYACIGDPSQYGHLICYYDFNEGTGSTLTDKAGDYDGTLMNMNDQAWVPSDVCAYGHNITFVVSENGTTPIGFASVDLDGEIKYTNGYGEVSFYYYAPGTYDYTVSKEGYYDQSGTVDVIDQDVTVDIDLLVTGILQNELSDVSIYPNPSNGIVNIRLPEEYSGNLTITDISGRVIDSFIINNGNQQIDLSGVEKGMYFIKLQKSNEVITLPLIVN